MLLSHLTTKKIFPFLILVLLVLFSFSCKRNISLEYLTDYVQNPKHGLQHEKIVNNTWIKLQYKPSELMTYQEMQYIKDDLEDTLELLRDKYNDYLYFILSFSPGGKEILNSAADREWFSEMVNKLSFGMEEYVLLSNEISDTIKLVTFNYPRLYGMSTSTDILFAFENKNLQNIDILTFEIKDFGLFIGDVKFLFRARDIRKSQTYRIRPKDIKSQNQL